LYLPLKLSRKAWITSIFPRKIILMILLIYFFLVEIMNYCSRTLESVISLLLDIHILKRFLAQLLSSKLIWVFILFLLLSIHTKHIKKKFCCINKITISLLTIGLFKWKHYMECSVDKKKEMSICEVLKMKTTINSFVRISTEYIIVSQKIYLSWMDTFLNKNNIKR